jgi:hypothetical protein
MIDEIQLSSKHMLNTLLYAGNQVLTSKSKDELQF